MRRRVRVQVPPPAPVSHTKVEGQGSIQALPFPSIPGYGSERSARSLTIDISLCYDTRLRFMSYAHGISSDIGRGEPPQKAPA